MDPWRDVQLLQGATTGATATVTLAFQDNFEPQPPPPVRDALPDSKQYLAILENKLNKLKSDSNVLGQLAAKRDACMRQLLADVSDPILDLDDPLDEPVAAAVAFGHSSSLRRALAPQTQALTRGELVELLKYDQLVEDDSVQARPPPTP